MVLAGRIGDARRDRPTHAGHVAGLAGAVAEGVAALAGDAEAGGAVVVDAAVSTGSPRGVAESVDADGAGDAVDGLVGDGAGDLALAVGVAEEVAAVAEGGVAGGERRASAGVAGVAGAVTGGVAAGVVGAEAGQALVAGEAVVALGQQCWRVPDRAAGHAATADGARAVADRGVVEADEDVLDAGEVDALVQEAVPWEQQDVLAVETSAGELGRDAVGVALGVEVGLLHVEPSVDVGPGVGLGLVGVQRGVLLEEVGERLGRRDLDVGPISLAVAPLAVEGVALEDEHREGRRGGAEHVADQDGADGPQALGAAVVQGSEGVEGEVHRLTEVGAVGVEERAGLVLEQVLEELLGGEGGLAAAADLVGEAEEVVAQADDDGGVLGAGAVDGAGGLFLLELLGDPGELGGMIGGSYAAQVVGRQGGLSLVLEGVVGEAGEALGPVHVQRVSGEGLLVDDLVLVGEVGHLALAFAREGVLAVEAGAREVGLEVEEVDGGLRDVQEGAEDDLDLCVELELDPGHLVPALEFRLQPLEFVQRGLVLLLGLGAQVVGDLRGLCGREARDAIGEL